MNRKTFAAKTGAALLTASLLATSIPLGATAASVQRVTALLRPETSIVVDGSARTFYNVSGQEVHPILYNGTTYLPLRSIGELMDKNVDWNQSTLTVTIGGARTTADVTGTPDATAKESNVTAELRPDFTIVVDGTVRTFQDVNGNTVYPMLYNGSTYLPVRAVGELMGKTVSWNGSTQTVTLSNGSLVSDADSFGNGSNGQQNGNQGSSNGTNANLISAETAKSKALAHAGLSASDVTFLRCHLEWDDGRQIYDVEFYTTNYKEYDYEIDARTGNVLSFDYDAEYYQSSNNTGNGTVIGEAKAKSIALARVPGATESNIRKIKLDRDDGRMEYEVEIVYNAMEYDFEIDAYSGNIISWDSESIYD